VSRRLLAVLPLALYVATTFTAQHGHLAFRIGPFELLLDIQREKGDPTAADGLVRKPADRFWGTDWPESSRPRAFYDPRPLVPEGPGGVLHAKAVVTDDQAVFAPGAYLFERFYHQRIIEDFGSDMRLLRPPQKPCPN